MNLKKSMKSDFGKELFNSFFGDYVVDEIVEGEIIEDEVVDNRVVDEQSKQEETRNKKTTSSILDVELTTQKTTNDEFEETVRKPATIVYENKDQTNNLTKSKFGLNSYIINNYLKQNGVVGEENLGPLLTISIANGMHVLLEGESGTGKTFLMNKVLSLFPQNDIYKLGLTSGQAIWHDAEKINGKKLVYIPEMQKAMSGRSGKQLSVIEFVKNLTEGQDATRIVTNGSKDGVNEYKIISDKTIISTIALENDFKYDRETQRRFLILQTDNSKEHIDDIINRKLEDKINLNVDDGIVEIEKTLADRIQKVQQRDNTYVLNPFAKYLKQVFPVTEKVQSYLDHYLNLFESFGKFFAEERETFKLENKYFVLLNLEDIYNVVSMYNDHFIRTMNSFSENEITPNSPDWNECLIDGLKIADELSITYQSRKINIKDNFSKAIDSWKEKHSKSVSIIDYMTGLEKEIANTNMYEISNPSIPLNLLEKEYDKT